MAAAPRPRPARMEATPKKLAQAWARELSDRELIAHLRAYLGDAELPRAVGEEVERRLNARKYGPR